MVVVLVEMGGAVYFLLSLMPLYAKPLPHREMQQQKEKEQRV
jgi:hypothetical protein